MKRAFFVVLIAGFSLFCAFMIISFSTIHRQVENITRIAVEEYGLNALESLKRLIDDEHQGFEEKNSAIWALGQFADPKALPFLENLLAQTEEKKPCDRSRELCNYEIQKAIKWCRQGNLTSWMYRNIEK